MRTHVYAGLILIALAGCTNRGPYDLAPVSGTVTMDGAPAAGASVVFQPRASEAGKNPGPGSSAFCDAAGHYELKTLDGQPGAVQAEHRVMIFGPRSDDPKAPEPYPGEYNGNSRLSFVVTSEGSESANFDLTSK